MSVISRIWDRITRSPTQVYAAFRIPSDRVVNSSTANEPFGADDAYFELRLAEQFLRDRREYHQGFIPVTLLLTEFIYEGQRRSFPFVVGPSLLQDLEQLEGDERVRYRNTRAAGPIPYRGDNVDLFVGLFRVKTKDWAKQALSLLESVGKAFDTSKLTSFISITNPLVDSIESFLGMSDDMQFRIGQRDSYTDPVGNNPATQFRAGYFVMIRSDQQDVDEDHFWVKQNQLFHGSSSDQLQPYQNRDYILLHINRLEARNDHTTFDFHEEWRKAQDQLWKDNKEGALDHLRELTYMIQRSPDLIPKHRDVLIAMYRNYFKEEMDLVSGSLEGLGPEEEPPVSKGPRHVIAEEDIQRALSSPEAIEDVVLEE